MNNKNLSYSKLHQLFDELNEVAVNEWEYILSKYNPSKDDISMMIRWINIRFDFLDKMDMFLKIKLKE